MSSFGPRLSYGTRNSLEDRDKWMSENVLRQQHSWLNTGPNEEKRTIFHSSKFLMAIKAREP